MNKKGRKKVIPSYFQKSGDSLSSILQAGSYQRKIKQVLQKNKEFAKENQMLKLDLSHSTKSLQRCTSYNGNFLLAKKKVVELVGIANNLIAGLNEVASFLDMKEYVFRTSPNEERRLKLPPQELDPIDECNSSVCEEADSSPSALKQKDADIEHQKTPISSNLPGTPKGADVSSGSLGTPVLCLSPVLPLKRPSASSDFTQEAPAPKRPKTPEKTAKRVSPKTPKTLSDKRKSPKPRKNSPCKSSPLSVKISPKHSKISPKHSKISPKNSKIPTRNKTPLPEPTIAFLPLSPPTSRKTFVVRKEDDTVSDIVGNRLRRETFKVPFNETCASSEHAPSPRRETVVANGPFINGQSLLQNAASSDDMEITTMLSVPPFQPLNPCPLPSSDEMELTAVLPVQCFLGTQNSAVPFKPVESSDISSHISETTMVSTSKKVPAASTQTRNALAKKVKSPDIGSNVSETTMVSTSKEVPASMGSGHTRSVLAKKKSLRIKKSLGVGVTDMGTDENCQPPSKRKSLDDNSINGRRKSVQFTFNECYNAFQNIKTAKVEPPKSILKQPVDLEAPKVKSPEPSKSEMTKAPLVCLNFSSSDDSSLTPGLPPDLFLEQSRTKRDFSLVSERRSKKKTISGGDVFNEIEAFEGTDPGCFVPMVPNSEISVPKPSVSSKEEEEHAEIEEPTSRKDGSGETEAAVGTGPSSPVLTETKSVRKSMRKTSASNKKEEHAELEEPTSRKDGSEETEAAEESGPGSPVLTETKCVRKSMRKTSASNKKDEEHAEFEEPMSRKDGSEQTEVAVESGPSSLVPTEAKNVRKPMRKTSASNKKEKECVDFEEPTCPDPENASKVIGASKDTDIPKCSQSLPKNSASKKKKKESPDLENPLCSENADKENKASKDTDIPKCGQSLPKTSASRKKKKESSELENPRGGKDVLNEIEVLEATDQDCVVHPVTKSKKKPSLKTSVTIKKKKEVAVVEEENVPAMKTAKKSKSKTQDDIEKIEVDVLTDPKRSTSFGRERRPRKLTSYQEPKLNSKMRREK